MPRSPFLRTTLASWLLLCAVVLWESRDLLRTPAYEQADDAANALSIDKAKHGREIYGNYSRFNFRHPGPAFVYVYAAGEAVLEDALGLVSPRHNAHLLTGILLQAAFLALAVAVAASHTSAPWRATGLLTEAALVHFALVPGAFTQIWPPLVLIMPFALLMVSAASVAAGRTGHLVWLALSAGFLLHGHVAQALFVGCVLALVAGTLAWRRLGGGTVALPSRAQGLAAALIAALTVLPWVIDAARGRASNLFDIWLHVRQSAHDPLRPSWAAAAADTASYLCYCTRQNEWFSPGASPALAPFLRAYGPGALSAALCLAACAWVLWRSRSRGTPAAAFQRHLACVCAVTLLLCVVWARRQDGGIMFFNSLFMFGLMLALWVIPLVEAAERAPGRWTAAALAVLAAATLATAGRYGRTPDYMEDDALGREAAEKVPRWLSREAEPLRPKLLIFGSDEWEQAVTVAAALNRQGIRCFVPESDYGIWREMFGEDHVIGSVEEARALGPLDWWRPALGRLPGLRLVSDPCDGAGGGPGRFPFSFDLRHPKGSCGLSRPDGEATWTESRVVFMRLGSEPARSDVRIAFRASGLPLARGESQRVRLMVNGSLLPEVLVTRLADYAVTVPREAWNRGPFPGLVDLAWGLPDAARLSAQPHATETDGRLLGICLHALTFELSDAGRR